MGRIPNLVPIKNHGDMQFFSIPLLEGPNQQPRGINVMTEGKAKSLGSAIDEILAALEGLDTSVQINALRAVSEHLKLPGIFPDREAGGIPPTPQSPPVLGVDIRTFRDQKQPSTFNEMVCVMAYYLQYLAPASERKDRIDGNDITKYFVQAGFQLPRAGRQVLVDAKDAGYLDALGGGQYRLNAVGHNLVTHSLPRQAVATAGSQRARRGSSSTRGRKKTTG